MRKMRKGERSRCGKFTQTTRQLRHCVWRLGWQYVEADSPEEAKDAVLFEEEYAFQEKVCDSVEELDEFSICLEE